MGCQKKKNEDSLGTLNSPEKAFQETQKALALISLQLNHGMKSVRYLQEDEMTTAQIFIKY
ncbi:hypothetical protein FUMI01_03990 [Flavobacterium sp. UMI-01]|nr:hypothetical protein FUMI01_03990 [Flavobacterium sp. UMI-01]